MVESIGRDLLTETIGRPPTRQSPRLAGPWKLIEDWSCDIYQYPGGVIPYIRIRKGKETVVRFKLTVARPVIESFMASIGVPPRVSFQILSGIYYLLQTYSLAKPMLKKFPKIRKKLPKELDVV